MTLNDYLLLGLVQYGLPVLFGVIVVASMGVPLPATLLLLTAGAFVEQGQLNVWWVVGLALCAALLGDHLGYGIGRWGSGGLIARIGQWGGGANRVEQAQQVARRWGGAGIFLSRWLMTPLGPVINLTSGIARYPLPAFSGFTLVGEVLWVGVYLTMGRIFSDQVQTLSSALGNFSYVIAGLAIMFILAQLLLRHHRSTASAEQAHVQHEPVRLDKR